MNHHHEIGDDTDDDRMVGMITLMIRFMMAEDKIISGGRLQAWQLRITIMMIIVIIVISHMIGITWDDKDDSDDTKYSQADDYKLGNCGVRWGYVLACVGFFDAIILGIHHHHHHHHHHRHHRHHLCYHHHHNLFLITPSVRKLRH